jgi:DNA replication protein DnaC
MSTLSAYCALCGGIGYVTEQAAPGDANFGALIPCACTRAERAQHRAETLRRMSNLDAYVGQTFESFDAERVGVAAAYNAAVSFAGQLQGWLSMIGGYGTGKTHLAAAIAQAALGRGTDVVFIVVPDLLDYVRASFDAPSARSYEQRLEQIRDVALLILDDLGTENTTAWAREKLYQIVNHRYQRRLPTVFTSNQDTAAIDGRIWSRLCDQERGARVVHIEAEDYRRRYRASSPPAPYGRR